MRATYPGGQLIGGKKSFSDTHFLSYNSKFTYIYWRKKGQIKVLYRLVSKIWFLDRSENLPSSFPPERITSYFLW